METVELLLPKFESALIGYAREEIDIIFQAFEFAQKHHTGQKRASGEEFIIHPLSIGIILAKMNVDYEMIVAGLLHDVVEDTDVQLSEIIDLFGNKIAELVDGVTKISKLKPVARSEIKAETIRKMLFAMINDMKVIIIKLADKIHNMSTLNFLPEEKRKRIANETMEIYAPLAGKMGMHFIKDQLEDLALRWINPDAFLVIKNFFDNKEKDRERTISLITRKLEEKLTQYHTPFSIKSRTKHYYSIFKKMKKYNIRIEDIYDLYGIRVITDSVENCYKIFGIIHTLWHPIPSRFRDFIAHPKQNGYRSLHTTVIVERGKAVEIQIRTESMHEFNEYGVAAHWYYKKGAVPSDKQLKWLTKLKEVHKQNLSSQEYYQIIRDDILKDEIYVFTPMGDIIELPKGATAVDFAYRIHTEVGHRCKSAKSNGAIIPLHTPLKNGALVEINTGKYANPKQAWLTFVKTSHARKKIKYFLSKRKEELKPQKPEPVKKEKIEDKVKLQKRPDKKNRSSHISVEVNGEKNLMFSFAKCCNPQRDDFIVGYVSRGRGIIIHKVDCHSLNYIKDVDKRLIDVSWGGVKTSTIIYSFFVKIKNSMDLYDHISEILRKYNGRIIEWLIDNNPNEALNGFIVTEIPTNKNVDAIIYEIKNLDGVFDIKVK